ncbi:bacterio-opsin activator domain-containing protein [Haloarcula onubensis]|uniref:Helix-turn-helix domain-containing protein n=1 Tax=Haloarcula onubensis TaxID=2950539 RepID=A0ABU2FSV2_9EURY|nr:bacterio-opsin activator domain-containing protein [Halomicroarcula sp. S3CR25-11]MDS0283835.1 helix-turn-helix domain-containing protein [Halomicroarcula sp. S3CR25-11]
MTVITDIEIPADKFALGKLLEQYPDIEIELVRVIPIRDGIIPLFWVDGADPDDIEATIHDDPLAEDIELLTETDGRYLFEIHWSTEIDHLIQPMIESRAEVLIAEGNSDRWTFRLQFANRSMLADFRQRCQDNNIHFELKALYNPTIPGEQLEEGELTSEQYDLLATAHENGYWHIPRDIDLGELADLIGISSNAASQRMRRGLDIVVGHSVAGKTD